MKSCARRRCSAQLVAPALLRQTLQPDARFIRTVSAALPASMSSSHPASSVEKAFEASDTENKGRLDVAATHAALLSSGLRPSVPREQISALLPFYTNSALDGVDLDGFKVLHAYLQKCRHVDSDLQQVQATLLGREGDKRETQHDKTRMLDTVLLALRATIAPPEVSPRPASAHQKRRHEFASPFLLSPRLGQLLGGEDGGFKREQWQTAWAVLFVGFLIMSITTAFRLALESSMITSREVIPIVFSCLSMSLLHLWVRSMDDQERAARLFHNTVFALNTGFVLPNLTYSSISRLASQTCDAWLPEMENMAYDDVIGAIGTAGTALFFILCGFPNWQRIICLTWVGVLILIDWYNRTCAGKPAHVYLLAHSSAIAFGLMVGLSVECMQRISYLRKLHAMQKTDAILTQCPTALIAMDVHGRIAALNDHSIPILGASREELTGLEFASTVVSPRYRQQALSAIEQACAGISTQSLVLTLMRLPPTCSEAAAEASAALASASSGGCRGDSEGIEVLMSTVPNVGDDGAVSGIVCFLQDCTEIKMLQREAIAHATEQARMRAIEENLAVTFHELRNPLNGCVGFQRLATQSLAELVAQAEREEAAGCEEAGSSAHAAACSGAGSSGEGSSGAGSVSADQSRKAPQSRESPSLVEGLKLLSSDLERALLCADHAVRFLQSLASIHRLFSHGLGETTLSLVRLSDVFKAAGTIVKPQLKEVTFERCHPLKCGTSMSLTTSCHTLIFERCHPLILSFSL